MQLYILKDSIHIPASSYLRLHGLTAFSMLYFQDHLFWDIKFSPEFFWISLFILEAVVQRCSGKKVFLEISQNSLENTCARVSFWIKIFWRRCFSLNFVKFIRTSFYIEHLRWLLVLFQYTWYVIIDSVAIKKKIHGKLFLWFLVFQKLIRCEMVW